MKFGAVCTQAIITSASCWFVKISNHNGFTSRSFCNASLQLRCLCGQLYRIVSNLLDTIFGTTVLLCNWSAVCIYHTLTLLRGLIKPSWYARQVKTAERELFPTASLHRHSLQSLYKVPILESSCWLLAPSGSRSHAGPPCLQTLVWQPSRMLEMRQYKDLVVCKLLRYCGTVCYNVSSHFSMLLSISKLSGAGLSAEQIFFTVPFLTMQVMSPDCEADKQF